MPHKTLLLVEDFAPDRELYRHYLIADSECDYTVLEVDSVIAGLAVCWEREIDAILLDYSLPDGNGIEFLQALHTENNGESPPVVMVTGKGDERVAVQAIKLGAEDYLLKRDVTPELLRMTIRSAIENAHLRKQLKESDDRFRVSIENMLDCFGIFSAIRDEAGQILDFRIDYLNAAALEANRMTRMAIGQGLCELLPAHQETGLFQEYCQLVETGKPLIKESLNYSDIFGQQQLTRAFDIRASKLGDGFVVSWRDITDRKRAEQRLQDSETQLKVGVEVAGVALARIDYRSNTVDLSPEAAAMYGLTADQCLVTRKQVYLCPRQRIHDTFHPEEREMMERIIAQVLDPAGDGWFALDHRVVWSTGEVRWLTVRKQVFFEQREGEMRPSYAILAAIDITDNKRIEADRERLLAEAEAANRSKDEFVALVAHELRSPLNSILGWSKLLQSRAYDEATIAKALETIERNTNTQVQLVEDLLDMSRIASGKLSIHSAPVNLANVINAAIEMVQLQAQAKQIQIQTQLTLTPQISGDWNRLQQIVVNLLTNAIKFTPEGGRVEVELMQIDTQVQVRVSDTGKGIAAEFLFQMFERFQQGQKSAGSKDGLGLGLAIVKNLVELHQGTITAESPGLEQGATFTICFPMLSTPAIVQESVSQSINATSLAGIRVLVVDDEPDMLNLITFLLEEYGAEVRSATSIAGAISLLDEFELDILLSDIAMPGGSGYDLIEEIRRLEVAQDCADQLPAIALTCFASTTYEERSLQAGFQRHLTKPVDPEVLVTSILDLVRLKR
ncbi:MAG: response regulator [Leptolyngbya sp. Prado105]|jgi:hypothetical protein|nr:response regulator [Leptolyngbya sp. Prado105]